MQSSWKMELERRKMLHQKVLELKGAIRVFCRVRPLQPEDGDTVSSILVKDQESLLINIPQIEERRRAASAPLHASSRASPPAKIVGRDFMYGPASPPPSPIAPYPCVASSFLLFLCGNAGTWSG
jgi:hypothetical protein